MGRPTPVRAIESRRIKATPELIANIRHRYEHSDERLSTMAADLGCSGQTVCNIAKREGWVRFEPPPRDLTPAARLLARAETLSPFVPAKAGTQGQDGKAVPCSPGFPLARERTDVVTPEQANTSNFHATIAEQMLHEVAGFLDDVRAERKRMKREGYAKHELQAVSRVIADLSASLNCLKPMAQRAAEPDSGNAYDDMPADLDTFRDELARRIDALLAEPPDEGDRAAAAVGRADEAAS